jgi:ABC-type Mn2+/Zn2+ transport system ATPase subunit
VRELSFYTDGIATLRGRRDFLKEKIHEGEKQISLLTTRGLDIEKAQIFIQQTAKATQEQLQYRIEDIVQLALDAVFPDEYIFKVRFEIKRGKTEARLCFLKNDIEVDPLDAAGGGVSDIVSFALRLAVWSLGHTERVIILDEPFKYLSKDLQPRAGEILKKLSKKLKLQIIMVSHVPDMIDVSDRVFEVSLKNSGEWKKSKVKLIS